jgi:hypothetical protein
MWGVGIEHQRAEGLWSLAEGDRDGICGEWTPDSHNHG